MTSLSNQLEVLRTATARHLTVEKRHISLLFDKKDAGQLNDQTIWRIGVAGLEQMKRIDGVFDGDKTHAYLFDEKRIGFVRSLLTQEENERLDAKIEKILFQLSPYLQHFACQQVLEYLVHTYHIYAYNAETLIVTFLPFHDTKIYARILRILDFDWNRSKEWAFMKELQMTENPIPFSSIVKATMAGAHSIITRLSDHISKGVELVGSDFLESKAPVLFNFYAKLLVSLFNDPLQVDEGLLSKLMPFVEHGIKSPMISFRYTAFMVVCQLVLTVKIKPEIVQALTKLIIMKIRAETVTSSLSTLAVICQQQIVDSFSNKAVQKLLRNGETFGVWTAVRDLGARTDLTNFLKPLWRNLFEAARGIDSEGEDSSLALAGLLETTDSNILTAKQAQIFLELLIGEASSGFFIEKKKHLANIRGICARFSDELDALHKEWTSRDPKILEEFLEKYQLKELVVIRVKEDAKKKKNEEKPNDESKKKKTAVEKAEEMAAASEFAKRKVFGGDPLNKARTWIEDGEWANVTWALEEMATRKSYLSGKAEDDVEEFAVELIVGALEKKKGLDLAAVKAALASTSLSPKFIADLLSKHDSTSEKTPKRPKGPRGVANVSPVVKVFNDESLQQFNKRVLFVLELLQMRDVVPASANVFQALFDIVKQINASNEAEQSSYQQQLAVAIVTKLLNNPGKYKVTTSDLDMDCVVETMRSTHSHHLLRDSLRLLTSAVKHSPADVVKHIMSVFTFMGNGLLRKDNEMTLGIVERTVESLFQAIILTEAGDKEKLIEVSRLFAASACDIPAHRRPRIARAIARAVGAENAALVTMVLLAGFCARWQRTTESVAQQTARKGTDQEAYDDFAVEMLGALDPFEQLSCVLELIEYVLRLGGDTLEGNEKQLPLDLAVFDRSTLTLPRLRHFRYVIVSLIARIFSNRTLIEKLAAYDDEELLERALPMSRRLMECSVELDDFAAAEADSASKSCSDAQTQRYWVAFSTRAEVVSEKLRHLLPGGVAARLIADVLKTSKTSYKMCAKALQLANIKLSHNGYFYTDSGINERELIALAEALNGFIAPETSSSDKIMLCQNSAFTLKLIAKHLPLQSESTVLSDTMKRCVQTVSQYQKLDDNLTGNVLLLAGELIRSHNMRSTMQHSVALLKVCLAILSECISKFANAQKAAAQEAARAAEENRLAKNRGQRIRQQSLGGLRLGSETLLICALTCVQRIFDQYASFVCEHVGDVVVRYCRLVGRFGEFEPGATSTPSTSSAPPAHTNGSQTSGNVNKSSVQHRLSLIRRALLTVELRVLPGYLSKAVEELKDEKKPLSALFTLITGYFDASNRQAVVQLRSQFVQTVFVPALEYRSRQRQPELFENIEQLERNVFDAIIAMAGILSEVEFRPVANALVAWAEPGLNSSSPLATRIRLVPLLSFANCFYNAYNSLALPYFGRILEVAVKVLRGCNATIVADSSQLIMSGKRGTIESLEVNLLLTLAIDLISNCARHKEFFSPDRCELVAGPLVDELVNTKVEGHEDRCTKHLVTALYRVGDADPDNFAELLGKILLKTRDNRPKIRYRTLLVLEALLDRIGDGIAPYLTLLVPYLNELDEDENKQVEDQCKRVVDVLQHKFGEQFWTHSSSNA
ncbi:unnamed protein product [Caenorhabditis auriculariae]|uniref:HEAT repeat-containing protein 1 n=1 Tax=Caenorhabditis auriculariae TaxID=2777116 RepID=A0A8S1H9L7_9PELO|nr:unnamed protein product [Caenorhabditis auriculariae]